jgi:hypothetical protein
MFRAREAMVWGPQGEDNRGLGKGEGAAKEKVCVIIVTTNKRE